MYIVSIDMTSDNLWPIFQLAYLLWKLAFDERIILKTKYPSDSEKEGYFQSNQSLIYKVAWMSLKFLRQINFICMIDVVKKVSFFRRKMPWHTMLFWFCHQEGSRFSKGLCQPLQIFVLLTQYWSNHQKNLVKRQEDGVNK